MRRLILCLAFALALLAPAAASAKELLGVTLCGASGCNTERSASLLEGPGGPFGSGEIVAPAAPGPWYHGYLLAGDGGKVMGRLPFYYVPEGRRLVQPGRQGQTTVWTVASGKLGKMLDRLSARVRPFSFPSPTAVTVDDARVADAKSYLRLWTIGSKAGGYPQGENPRQVAFFTARPTPWSDGNYLAVYPKAHLLIRDGELVSLPRATASRVAAGASLGGGGSTPWGWIAGVAGGVLGLVALAVGLRAVRPRPAPAPAPAEQA